MAGPLGKHVLTMAMYFRAGHMPRPGGVLDQGAKTMDLISIACSEVNAITESASTGKAS